MVFLRLGVGVIFGRFGFGLRFEREGKLVFCFFEFREWDCR